MYKKNFISSKKKIFFLKKNQLRLTHVDILDRYVDNGAQNCTLNKTPKSI